MKRIFAAIVAMTLFMGCTNTDTLSKKETVFVKEVPKVVPKKVEKKPIFTKEISNLKIIPGAEKLQISWTIEDTKDVEKIEIMAKKSDNKIYKSVKIVDANIMETEIPVSGLISYDIKIRLISKEEFQSSGVIAKKVIANLKNVIYDKCQGRELQIYLPSGYNGSSERYPVVYLHDGENLFSSNTTENCQEELHFDEVADKLIAENKIDKIILVAIYNSDKRTDEYVPYDLGFEIEGCYGGKADSFAEFIVKQIVPYIDEKYRTIPDRENRAVMGYSFGGILSLWMGMKYSDVFSMIGAMSPSLWVGNEKILEDLEAMPKKDMKIWLDRGSEEFDPSVRQAVNILTSKNYIYGKDIMYYEDKGARHDGEAWTKRFVYPLIMFKGKMKDIKMIDFVPQLEVIETPYLKDRERFVIINPVAEFDNGMKYTLCDGIKFSSIGNAKFVDNIEYIMKKDEPYYKEDILMKVNIKGNLELKGDKETEVIVSYGGMDKKMIIKESDILPVKKK